MERRLTVLVEPIDNAKNGNIEGCKAKHANVVELVCLERQSCT
jgi:hypothetical protein